MTCGKGRIMSEKTNKVKGSRSDYLQGLKDGLPIGLGYLWYPLRSALPRWE